MSGLPPEAPPNGASRLAPLAVALGASLVVLVLRSNAAERRQRQLEQGAPPPSLRPVTVPQQPGRAARLQLWGGLLIVIGQLLALNKSGLQPSDWQAATFLALATALLIVLPGLWPLTFERHRHAIVALARVVLFAQPITRNPRGMQYVFQAHPSEHRAGLVQDLWRLLMGARGLAMFCTHLACPLPILPSTALAIFALQRCRTAQYMCSCPLLAHPLSRQRIAKFFRLVHKLPLLVPERPPLRALAAEADGLDCRVFVTFVQLLVGVALPALMVAHLQAPLHAAAAAAVEQQRRARRRAALRSAASLDSQDSQQSSEGSEGSEVRSPRTCGWNSRLSGTWAALGEAAHELEGFIQHLCAMLAGSTRLTPNSWVLTASAWWLLLSLTWVLALMLEQPVGGAAGAGAAALT